MFKNIINDLMSKRYNLLNSKTHDIIKDLSVIDYIKISNKKKS